MNITLRLAWRNLWRHRRRTWLTVGAMIFCNVLLVFLISLKLGSYNMMIESTLNASTGHIQVQHQGYLDDQKMRQTVPDVAQLADSLRGRYDLQAVAARASAFALASSEERSFGIQVSGVQPEFETQVSTFPGLVKSGRYLQGSEASEVVIGAVLAENLKVKLGDEITLLGSGLDGSFAAAVATVVGIVETGIDPVDRSVAQVPLAWFQEVFAMGDQGHAVVMQVADLDLVPAALQQVQAHILSQADLIALDWDTLLPGLQQAITSDMTSAWFMYGVLILLVAFSVLNTQLMSVLERTREFGVMLALGMAPGKLARLVGIETLLMAILGLTVGVLLGAMVAGYFNVFGFYYPGMDEMAARFNLPGRMYPEISFLSLFWGPGTVFLGVLFAAIYPAMRLYQLQPVDAMRAV